ncbi:hypothetical protein CWB99_03255 [Pseudoalteromonas rubra]|uniref:Uncharacterized protein n=1 Tax=Pseudoalteromonas rubra TaxID=43658 RepID=A0A5S3WSX5_9GAMM|nr:hypothetical protein [Pseudoalteromonas rubra]TMP30139.1 hypothetical protein CWC00_17230 [Pseudoalteromonas rubra]TMP31993.1 hypothetical protein CWB99_03255 [Pseudoalteromonas rubra]
MNKDSNIGAEAARASLIAANGAKRQANLLLRPPVWLNVLISLLAALATTASAQASQSSFWTLIAIGAALSVIALALGWSHYLRVSGVKAKPLKGASKKTLTTVTLAFSSAFIVLLAIYLTKQGIWQSAYVAGAMIFLFSSFAFYKLPAGEWLTKDSGNE